MNEEIHYEITSTLTKELGAQAIRKIFLSTKFNKRLRDLIVAIFMSVAFVFAFSINLIDFDLLDLLLSLFILGMSVYFYYCYFRGYSFPKSMYLRQINNLCTPPTRRYIFRQTQFAEETEQSTRTIYYSQIEQMIDSENLLILLASSQQFIISKECLPDNYVELITHIRNSSHCSYWK